MESNSDYVVRSRNFESWVRRKKMVSPKKEKYVTHKKISKTGHKKQ